MLAEDNPVNQKVARGVFELLGCQVSLAKDGREAVALAAETEFDLIFMDCQMPVMDGYEAARQIRAVADAANHVPIIALTANALCEVREACLDAGMDDFLTKPVNREQLDQMIVKWEPAVCSRD
jgi:CheY-like chemotaxis protein